MTRSAAVVRWIAESKNIQTNKERKGSAERRKVDIMRRSNSKEVNNLIRDFVMEHFNNVYYPDNKDWLPDLDASNYNDVSKVVLDVFYQEKVKITLF